MRRRTFHAARFLAFFATATISTGFIWGGKIQFANASSGAVFVRYISTTGPHSGDIIRGGRLSDSTDNGELISVTVQYKGGRTKSLSASEVLKLKRALNDHHGVWWIDDTGISYVSGRTANIRQRKMFGHW
jgi:hypothetical protein